MVLNPGVEDLVCAHSLHTAQGAGEIVCRVGGLRSHVHLVTYA